jgi:hypothetical protein
VATLKSEHRALDQRQRALLKVNEADLGTPAEQAAQRAAVAQRRRDIRAAHAKEMEARQAAAVRQAEAGNAEREVERQAALRRPRPPKQASDMLPLAALLSLGGLGGPTAAAPAVKLVSPGKDETSPAALDQAEKVMRALNAGRKRKKKKRQTDGPTAATL